MPAWHLLNWPWCDVQHRLCHWRNRYSGSRRRRRYHLMDSRRVTGPLPITQVRPFWSTHNQSLLLSPDQWHCSDRRYSRSEDLLWILCRDLYHWKVKSSKHSMQSDVLLCGLMQAVPMWINVKWVIRRWTSCHLTLISVTLKNKMLLWKTLCIRHTK